MHVWHAFVQYARVTSYQVWQRVSTTCVVRIRFGPFPFLRWGCKELW